MTRVAQVRWVMLIFLTGARRVFGGWGFCLGAFLAAFNGVTVALWFRICVSLRVCAASGRGSLPPPLYVSGRGRLGVTRRRHFFSGGGKSVVTALVTVRKHLMHLIGCTRRGGSSCRGACGVERTPTVFFPATLTLRDAAHTTQITVITGTWGLAAWWVFVGGGGSPAERGGGGTEGSDLRARSV